MIIPDHKKMMATAMARRAQMGEPATGPGTPVKPEVVKSEDGEPDGRHAAAEDMIAAFHEKSPHKLMQSLANFMELHKMKSEEPAE